MSTFVAVNTYTHAVTYVTEKLLTSVKTIIRLSGLSPERMVGEWTSLERAISTWLQSQHLKQVVLEVYEPRTDQLVGRWDFEIHYGFQGDGSFWVDPEAIKYHILKQGHWPSSCDYRIVIRTKPGEPSVPGWGDTFLRSTTGFVKQSIGTTIDGTGLSTGTGYWRKL